MYRTTKPIPVYGNWKVTVRLQKGAAVMGLPVYFPNDPAIPVGGIPAQANFDRAFVRDKKNLQREQKSGVPGILTALAYAGGAASSGSACSPRSPGAWPGWRAWAPARGVRRLRARTPSAPARLPAGAP